MNDIFNMKRFPFFLQFKESHLEHFKDLNLELLHEFHNKASELATKTTERAEEIRKNISSDDDYAQFDFLGEDYEKYSQEFINHINQTIFVFSYSFLESSLKEYLNYMINNIITPKGTFDISVIKNDYFGNYKKGIEIVVGIDIRKHDKDFQELKKFQFVRNKIIHNNAHISTQKDINKIKALNLITFNEKTNNFFLYDKKFVEGFIETIVIYLNSILKELKTQISNFN